MARSQAMDEWKGALPDSRHGGFQILDKESKEPILYHPIPGAKNTGRMVREQNAGRERAAEKSPSFHLAGSHTQKKLRPLSKTELPRIYNFYIRRS